MDSQRSGQESTEDIINRVSQGEYLQEDIERLSRLIKSSNSEITQIGKYNVNVGNAGQIQIGDKVYEGPSAEVIQQALDKALELQSKRRRTTMLILGGTIMLVALSICGIISFIFLQWTTGPSNPFPSEVQDMALQRIQNQWCQNQECDQFEVAHSSTQVLSNADKANDVEGRWCIFINYISRRNASDSWGSEHKGFMITKEQGEYSFFTLLDEVVYRAYCLN